jgi:TetR/AcrR family transcriptional regulator, regulator of cefoperazone and chloramphenicol sensitivity
MLNVRSVNDTDLTRKAVIRNEALRLFAAKGADAVTIREIAEAAGVSAPLVIHHFGGKQQLVEAVNDYAIGIWDSILEDLGDGAASTGASPPLDAGGLADALVRNLPAGSALPAYLRRLVLDDGPEARRLFERWFATVTAVYGALVDDGVARPSSDPAVRAAFLLVNDLAMILLRPLIVDVVGIDPLTPEGAQRWAANAMDVYTNGAFDLDPKDET